MADRLDALAYHELTKHSAVSVRSSGHFLDWDNQPLPFKIYLNLEPIPLPRDFSRNAPDSGATSDRAHLGRLLHFTGGIMRKRALVDGTEYYFRAAACTGALYHIDLYVVCTDLTDLEAGVYHFGPHDFSLRRLRRGDHRGLVIEASGDQPAIARAPIILICTSTFWRNSWKYQSRTYRHCFWDNGTMLANLLEVAAAAKVPTSIVLGFADRPINDLLGLDTTREVAVSCVALGDDNGTAPLAPPLTTLDYQTKPLSRHEVDYPAIRAAHAGSSLDTPADARQWRANAFLRALPEPTGKMIPLATSADIAPTPIEQTIARRGSSRSFSHEPIAFAQLSHILRTAVVDVETDFAPTGGADASSTALLNDVYLIVNAVDGLAAGTYVYRRDQQALELLKAGDFRSDAGYLDLGQELAADAAVNFYVLSDLRLIVERLGDRGYRAAALEAAIIGGRIYLAAYALALGATGLTFFDDDVTAFFSPHAVGKGVLFLTAVGHPRRHR